MAQTALMIQDLDIPGLKKVIESMSMREFNKIIMACRSGKIWKAFNIHYFFRKCDTESHGLLNETAILECIRKIFPEVLEEEEKLNRTLIFLFHF